MPLYEQDLVLWSIQQAQALRDAAAARINTPTPIDWGNVAEEIESLGRSQRSELRSSVHVVIEHLLKLQASPDRSARADLAATIRAQRSEIDGLLEDSPSLRGEIQGMIDLAVPRARRAVSAHLADRAERPLIGVDQLNYTPDQVLDDWFPVSP